MAARRCMNVSCAAADPGGGGFEWRKGWPLRSGGFAMLCVKCGMAYEQFIFCDIYHQKESGWRECLSCGKQLHCGCIVSKSSFDLLDSGGIQCIGCMKNSGLSLIPTEGIPLFLPQDHQRVIALSARSLKDEKLNDSDMGMAGSAFEMSSYTTDRKANIDAIIKGKSISIMPLEHRENESGSFGQIKWEQIALKLGDTGITDLSNRHQTTGSIPMSQQDEFKDVMGNKTTSESLSTACLTSLGTGGHGNKNEGCFTAERPFISLAPLSMTADEREQSKSASAFQQMQRARCFLPKPPKAGIPLDGSKDMLSHMRVARPPAEGRGRNQLLPRYWPRITDQELQQISGDSNSTIVPLFEKVLSASDAGRIGRLVLPKACAEAYFPPISQPEGLPLTIQDAKGKEWHFQFRFWPNNNSRMYVLEGVTPCIQSLQLQAGDTVTFSRIDPEGKLVMGFRKATNNVPLQDSQISAIANCALGNESFFMGAGENLPIVSGYSGLLQQLKGSADLHLTFQSEHTNSADGDFSWYKTDRYEGMANDGLQMQPSYKRSRNIGRSRRMLMDREEALELKITWEEAQDLLRPPPSEKPSVVTIEDHEIEEYEEPPVFGKKTIFTARASGDQDQWVQCDDCFKWRRLPADVLLPSRWTCVDNTYDPKRSSCSAPAELSQKEMQILVQNSEDLVRQRSSASIKYGSSDLAASGFDALAAAAVLGDTANQSPSLVATTTKHPRHRPGCSCIVCIQPPSGKGPKHNPACTCNVCMTVKRRFKTLMMRKKKRQFEREEAEALKKVAWGSKDDTEGTSNSLKNSQPLDSQQDNDLGPAYNGLMVENLELSNDQIDLNSHPGLEEGAQSIPRLSMMSLLQVANRPLETYLKQNGLTSLACEQGNQESPSLVTVPQAPGESEGKLPDEGCQTSAAEEPESGDADEDGSGSA